MTSLHSTTFLTKDKVAMSIDNYKENNSNSDVVYDRNVLYEGTIPTHETTDNIPFQIKTSSNDNDNETDQMVLSQYQTHKQFVNRELSFNSKNDLNASRGLYVTPRVKYETVQKTGLHLNKDQYRDEIMTICLKRKESLSKVNHSFRERSLTREYDSNMAFLQKRAKKIEDMRLDALNSVMEPCTFKPELSSKSMKLIADSKAYHSFCNCYERNTNWKRKVNRRNYHQFTLELSRQFEEFSFHPKTNEGIHERVMRERKRSKPNSFYLKTVQWLSDVKKKNKEAALEQIDLIMMNQPKVTRNKSQLIKEKESKNTNRENPSKAVYEKKTTQSKLSKTVNYKNENCTDKDSVGKIQQLKQMVIDLNQTVEMNKKFIQKIGQSQYTSVKTSQKRHYKPNHTKHPISLNKASLRVNPNCFSNRSCNLIKANRLSLKSQDEINYKCQLLWQKYYREKQEENANDY